MSQDKLDTVPVWDFQKEVRTLNNQRIAVMEDAGRASDRVNYSLQAQTIRDWQKALAGKLDSVSSWVLPIIYGALGSVVYCVWRVLSPSHSPLGAFYTILRTAFAGLAALTLSMLLIPSNQLATGGQADWPLIYLLAFIFGYSIEAFINTLNHLNTAVGRLVSPKSASS